MILTFQVMLIFAQAPQQFSFQGVARKADGKVAASTMVSIRLSIHSEATGGAVVYQETHSTQTNVGGIFNIQIGGGSIVAGTFAAIPWKTFPHFLQLEMDPLGGSAYTDLGTTQMLSVPYAMQAKESTKWNDGFPVVQKFEFGPDINPGDPDAVNDPDVQKYLLPLVGNGDRLLWYPLKGAFRVGESLNGKWEAPEIGARSVAFGGNNLAKGDFSFAVGLGAAATGQSSAAIGQSSSASGISGMAFGLGSLSKAYGSVALGTYNACPDVVDPASALPTEVVFQVGHGVDPNNRKSGITMLRNGNLGIGNNVLAPEYLLDVGGRMRIRHNGTTSGIHFDNSQNAEHGFMGMKTDAQIGFYINNAWRFWVDNAGNGNLGGTLTQSSDRRLKRDFSPLSSSLGKLINLNGYHYYWKDKERDQSLQTGLIAQDVEALFPELVQTDDKGFKSLNYTGLIPHLIESVKELAKQNAKLEAENAGFKAENKTMNDKLAAIAARLDLLIPSGTEATAK